MKTYEQLMTHYWGTIVPMAESAGINPWECVRISNISTTLHTCHPDFSFSPERYTFALAALESKPVFEGDKLYSKLNNRQYVMDGNFVSDPQNWTWTPHTKKLTLNEGALNAAGLGFLESYKKIMKEPESNKLFNNIKPILRETIIKYLEETDKE